MAEDHNGTAPKKKVRRSQLAAYSDLFERFLDPGFLITLDEFRIVDANEAVTRVLGVDAKSLFGKSLLRFAAEDEESHFSKNLRVARRRYYPRQFDCRWVASDGTNLIMEVAASLLKLKNGDEVLQVIARDVTRSRQAEEKASEYLAELQKVNKKLEELSRTDELTQIANVRQFRSELLLEHNRAQRYQTPYAVVFCDVDHFKKYNDRNGHPAGDRVLKGVAQILHSSSRATDLPARYGGEEFVVLCRGSDAKGARTLAERIRRTVAAYPFEYAEAQPLGKLSVSVGVASYPADAADPKDLLKRADDALYVSKESGRNRVTLAADAREAPSEPAQTAPPEVDEARDGPPDPREIPHEIGQVELRELDPDSSDFLENGNEAARRKAS